MVVLNRRNDFNQSYLEYIIQDMDIIDTFCEGMMKNNSIDGLISLSFQQTNDEKYYSYNITGLISLEEYIRKQIKKDELIQLFTNILNVFEVSQEYMIDNRYFLLNNDYIFINPVNKKVQFIVLPIENYASEKNIGYFIKNTLMTVNYHPNENTVYVTEILNFINNNPTFTIHEMKSFLQSIRNSTQSYVKPSLPVQKEPVRVIEKPKTLQQPHTISKVEVKKEKVLEDKPIEIKNDETSLVETPMSRRKDGIPTLRKIKRLSNQKKEMKVSKKENPLPIRKKTTIPKKSEPKNSIPTLKKRKAPDVSTNVSSSLNSEISGKYDKTVTTGDFSGTTVLGLDEGTTVLSEGTTLLTDSEIIRYPKIRRLKTNQMMEITKNVFGIGKDSSYNDFIINDNSAISRKHAEIRLINGIYYITDLHSTNKTYVDGKVVQPGYQIELMSGSLIRMANEDFIFEL